MWPFIQCSFFLISCKSRVWGSMNTYFPIQWANNVYMYFFSKSRNRWSFCCSKSTQFGTGYLGAIFSLSEVGPYYWAITILSINLYLTVVVENLSPQTEKIDSGYQNFLWSQSLIFLLFFLTSLWSIVAKHFKTRNNNGLQSRKDYGHKLGD